MPDALPDRAASPAEIESPDGPVAGGGSIKGLPITTLVIAGLFVLGGVFAPVLASHSPYSPDLSNRLRPPSSEFWLGTDSLGRDMASRILFGARTTLVVVVGSALMAATVGLVLGMFAGYIRGRTDAVISRITEGVLAFPAIFFGLLFAATIGSGLGSVVAAISLVLWARFAQVIRGEVISIREKDFVAIARINGCSHLRIMIIHVLPNVVNTFMVLISINVGYIIIVEASLSFLGAGIPPPNPSWGGMIAEGQAHISTAWWIAVVPGIAILMTVLALNILGDWLRFRLDPKSTTR